MLLPLQGRRIAYDLVGPEDAPTVCITHSLASDGGSWAEQVPALLQAGFRVLRLDMRGHGGSDPVAGDYTMAALADDVAQVLGGAGDPAGALHRPVDRRHDRPGLRDGARRAADLGDVVRHPAGEPLRRGRDIWDERMGTVRRGEFAGAARRRRPWSAGSPTPSRRRTRAAGSRSATPSPARRRPAISAAAPRSWISISPARSPRCGCRCWSCAAPRTPAPRPAENRRLAGLVPGARYEEIAGMRHFPNVEAPDAVQPHHAGLARTAQTQPLEHDPGRLKSLKGIPKGSGFLIQDAGWGWGPASMARPYSLDLRERVVGSVAAGRRAGRRRRCLG